MSDKYSYMTEDEKVAEMYAYFRKRKKGDILDLAWKWLIRSGIIISLGYAYLHPTFITDFQLDKKLSTFVGGIASGVVQDMANSGKLGGGMMLPSGTSTTATTTSTESTSNNTDTSATAGTPAEQCIRMTNSGTLIFPNGMEVAMPHRNSR